MGSNGTPGAGDRWVTRSRVWSAASEVLRGQLSDAVWMSTFAEVVPADGSGGIVLAVPNRWTKDRIEERHLDAVRAALADVGVAETDVVVEIRPEPPETPDPVDPLEPSARHQDLELALDLVPTADRRPSAPGHFPAWPR